MGPGQFPGNGQAQAGAAGPAGSLEGPEQVFLGARRQAGAVIGNVQDNAFGLSRSPPGR